MKQHRAILASLFALVLGVAVGGGGCANGGGEATTGDDDGGGDEVADVTLPDVVEAAACPTAGQTKCNSGCTSLQTDKNNCGKCGTVCAGGQVCNAGVCGYSCAPPQTLCNAPPEAGPPEAGGGEGGGPSDGSAEGSSASDAAAHEAGSSVDSGSSSSDAATSSDGSAGDGAATTDAGAPYCANLNNDNNNCGACGTVCTANHVCNALPNGAGGACGLSCGTGEVACIAGDLCIPANSCCSSTDCPVTGEICPQPGGACQCPSGESICTNGTYNSCISSNDCCTDSDCASLAGATCPTPGQACQCATGQKACLASKQCIAPGWCCDDNDCGPESGVQSYSCSPTNGQCSIAKCDAGCYDLDSTFTNGCECCDDKNGKTCGVPTVLGTLSSGKVLTAAGQLPVAGESDWLQVTFNNESSAAFHGLITFTSNPNNAFAFDVASSCSGGTLACGEGGSCTGKTTWEVSYAQGDPTGQTWEPIAAIGTVYIRVYRVSGAVSCGSWALKVTE